MAEKFYSLLTNIGKARIANSVGLGTKINFVTMKVGDGGGAYYEPTEDQTDLKNTVWSGNINHVEIDKDNPNWINIEVMVPSTVGGFTIREYGAYDEQNNLLAICKCAETYKPVIADGSTKELLLNMVLAVSNAENVTLKIDPTIIFAKKSEVEQLKTDIATQLSDLVYQTAGGTATAITLIIKGTLVNGYPITFVASTNNSGAVTTINGKKLYKPGTTISPNLIAGKAYTVWYSSTGDCFFIKASATGTALASQVLKDVPYSNENETDLVGTMPNNGALGTSLAINGTYTIPAGYTSGGTINQSIATKSASTINPSTVNQTITAGQYLTGDQTILGDSDLIASNIISTANIFGVQGSATIESLGGRKFSTGAVVFNNYQSVTLNLGFTPNVVIMMYNDGSNINFEYDYYVAGNTNTSKKLLSIVNGSGNQWWNSTGVITINGTSVTLWPRYVYTAGITYTYYIYE